MWKSKASNFHQFTLFLRNLPASHYLLAASIYLLALLYPGQNSLQTIVIKPGTVKSYDLSLPSIPLYPVSDGESAPYTSARGIVIQDVGSKAILYARGADTPMIPASTTKIMTALVAREGWQDLESVITVQNEDRAIGQTIELQRGEQFTLHNMLKGLLIHSGNDAALALADNYCAPSGANGGVGPCGYDAFVKAMNAKAKELNLDRTTYRNPSGIEQYGHVTTPRDLAVLSSVAVRDPVIAEIVSTKFTTVTDLSGQITHPLESTNELLGVVPGLKGLKTGWTSGAGECLVSYIERDGHEVIIVLLGSSDRFGETARLVDWVYSHHNWISPEL